MGSTLITMKMVHLQHEGIIKMTSFILIFEIRIRHNSQISGKREVKSEKNVKKENLTQISEKK